MRFSKHILTAYRLSNNIDFQWLYARANKFNETSTFSAFFSVVTTYDNLRRLLNQRLFYLLSSPMQLERRTNIYTHTYLRSMKKTESHTDLTMENYIRLKRIRITHCSQRHTTKRVLQIHNSFSLIAAFIYINEYIKHFTVTSFAPRVTQKRQRMN